jgi:hypothetical protein
MDMTGGIKYLLEGLRSGKNPDNAKLKPIEQRRRGYQLYVKEQKQMGEPAISYEEWLASQE